MTQQVTTPTQRLSEPHGGTLTSTLVSHDRAVELRAEANSLRSWTLTARQLCDLELLSVGAFSPLTGFLGEEDYRTVLRESRLASGTLWPIPVTLDVDEETASATPPGSRLALRDPEGVLLAVLQVRDSWRPDREVEAQEVYGTTDPAHPGVAYLQRRTGPVYLGGEVETVQLPAHFDFAALRRTPAEVRALLTDLGVDRLVAFQTRNPMHRAHVELTRRAADAVGAHLLLHPVVGQTKPGDVDHFTRVRCYERVLDHLDPGSATLSLLPLAMRMAGPREAVWHAIIRKNYGVTHFIVGRDHAGPSKPDGGAFYGAYEAQDLLRQHELELGIEMVPFRALVFVPSRDAYLPVDEVPEGEPTLSISGTELRERLSSGQELPGWFTYPEVAQELRRTFPPRQRQGVTVFFTGLSGAGKSTIANIVQVRLLELGGRSVTLLDGDLVRAHLSSELGFSREHRDLNVQRIGFVASEIARNGGVAICAPIAPYETTREHVRAMVENAGGFFLMVHVATSLEECERRDRKGLYAQARAGLIDNFTGISDPYEVPSSPELVIDTAGRTATSAAEEVISYLQEQGLITRDGKPAPVLHEDTIRLP